MTFAEKFAKALALSGLSGAELERRLDVAAGMVSQWKNGKSLPTTENLVQIARHFDLPFDYWLDDRITDPAQVRSGLAPLEAALLNLAREMGLDEAMSRISLARVQTAWLSPVHQPPRGRSAKEGEEGGEGNGNGNDRVRRRKG